MKLLNIYIKLSVLTALVCSGCNTSPNKVTSPKKDVVFKFEANNKNLSKNNFTVNRIFVNDSIFTDRGILCNDTSSSCEIKFSLNNKGWSVWTGSNWISLFDDNGLISKVNLEYTEKTIKPTKLYILGHDTLYSFTCRDESVDFSTDYNEYLLSKKDGIVIVKNEMTFYKRADYNNINLEALYK